MKAEIRNKSVEKHVLSLWKEGWHVSNISQIAHVSVGLARQILTDKGINNIS